MPLLLCLICWWPRLNPLKSTNAIPYESKKIENIQGKLYGTEAKKNHHLVIFVVINAFVNIMTPCRNKMRPCAYHNVPFRNEDIVVPCGYGFEEELLRYVKTGDDKNPWGGGGEGGGGGLEYDRSIGGWGWL